MPLTAAEAVKLLVKPPLQIQVYDTIYYIPNIVEAAVPFFLASILIEFVFGWWKGKRLYRLNDTFADLLAGYFQLIVVRSTSFFFFVLSLFSFFLLVVVFFGAQKGMSGGSSLVLTLSLRLYTHLFFSLSFLLLSLTLYHSTLFTSISLIPPCRIMVLSNSLIRQFISRASLHSFFFSPPLPSFSIILPAAVACNLAVLFNFSSSLCVPYFNVAPRGILLVDSIHRIVSH